MSTIYNNSAVHTGPGFADSARTASKQFVVITSNSHQVTILIFTPCNLIVDSTCKLHGRFLREHYSNDRMLPIVIPHLPKLPFLRALMFRLLSQWLRCGMTALTVWQEYAVRGPLCKTVTFLFIHKYTRRGTRPPHFIDSTGAWVSLSGSPRSIVFISSCLLPFLPHATDGTRSHRTAPPLCLPLSPSQACSRQI
jgi:hypothetical protein